MSDDDDCRVCEMTLAELCATGAKSPRLCGLCRLLPPRAMRRYVKKWPIVNGEKWGWDEHDRS